MRQYIKMCRVMGFLSRNIAIFFCVIILRSPYGLVRDANEMLMTWAAKRLENVLKTLRYSNEFMLYNYSGNTSLYQ